MTSLGKRPTLIPLELDDDNDYKRKKQKLSSKGFTEKSPTIFSFYHKPTIESLIETFFGINQKAKELAINVSDGLKYNGNPETIDTTLEAYIIRTFQVNEQLLHIFKLIQPHQLIIGEGHTIIPHNIFIDSELYLHTDNNGLFNKTYIIFPGDNYTKLSIIREIALQQYAFHLLETTCSRFKNIVTIPRIIGYSEKKIVIDGVEKTIINMKMEKLSLMDRDLRQTYTSTSENDEGLIKFYKNIMSFFRATRILIADLRRQKKYERIFTKFKTTGLLFVYVFW